MKIKRVIIQRKDKKREFIFDEKINLIYSKDNSKGKTTYFIMKSNKTMTEMSRILFF